MIDFTCSFPEDVADEFDAAGVIAVLHDQPELAAQEFAQEMCERSDDLAEQFDGGPGLPVVVEWQGKTEIFHVWFRLERVFEARIWK